MNTDTTKTEHEGPTVNEVDRFVSSLQANPQLRAAVLVPVLRGMCDSDFDEYLGVLPTPTPSAQERALATAHARLRAAESALAAARLENSDLSYQLGKAQGEAEGHALVRKGLEAELATELVSTGGGDSLVTQAARGYGPADVSSTGSLLRPAEQAKDSAPCGQKVESNVGPESEPGATAHRRRGDDSSAGPERREPSVVGLAGREADPACDDRRAEGGTEEPGASAGHHQAGGSAALGGRSDDGGVGRQHIVDGFLTELGCTVRDCLGCGCLVPGGPTRCIRCANESSPTAGGGDSPPPAQEPADYLSRAESAIEQWGSHPDDNQENIHGTGVSRFCRLILAHLKQERAYVTAIVDARVAELAKAAAESIGETSYGWAMGKLAEAAGAGKASAKHLKKQSPCSHSEKSRNKSAS